MMICHFAPALAVSRFRHSLKLWQLFLATQLVDLCWAVLVWLDIEHVRIVPSFTRSNDLDLWDMPYSHGLLATAGWGVLVFLGWRFSHRGATRSGDALLMALAVMSHFVADLIVHVRDLPVLAAQGTKLGFGLWQRRGLSLTLETSSFALAALFWWWPRRSSPGGTRAAVWLALMTGLAAGSYFTPAPPAPGWLALASLCIYGSCAALACWAEHATCAPQRAAEGYDGMKRAA